MVTEQPPSRLSIDDPRIDWSVAGRIEVLFNGIPQTCATAYDVDARTITRYLYNELGEPVVIDGNWATVTLTGDVAVRWKAL